MPIKSPMTAPTGIPTKAMKNETIELPPVYPMLAPICAPPMKPAIQPKMTSTILNKTVNIFIYDYLLIKTIRHNGFLYPTTYI